VRLTVKQAATRAGVSAALVYQWTSAKRRLPHLRAGRRGSRGRILIDEADLEAFLATLRVGGGPPPPPAPGPPTPRYVHLRP